MTFKKYIQDKKILVSDFLNTYLKQTALPMISPVSKWGSDGITRILHSATQGKMIRSALMFLGAESVNQNVSQEQLIPAAAAIELFHTGLLMQDDIMDQDEKRRGQDSLYIQYSKLLTKEQIRDPKRTGESFALCMGDMTFFLGFRMVSKIQPPELTCRIIELLSTELAHTAAAQMQDVYGGVTPHKFTVEDSLNVYVYKTGRYSIGLPLVIGGTIANAPKATITNFWKLGASLGILYQLRDDELNIFGNPEQTGKPIGSDIREAKQTVLRSLLETYAATQQKQRLTTLYGNSDLSLDDIDYIRHVLQEDVVQQHLHTIRDKQVKTVEETIALIPMPNSMKLIFEAFAQYCSQRVS